MYLILKSNQYKMKQKKFELHRNHRYSEHGSCASAFDSLAVEYKNLKVNKSKEYAD